MTPAELHERLQALRQGQAPLPLTDGQAVAQAVRLRSKGLSYTTIATVMLTYHGHAATDQTWSHRCRRMGVAPDPRGVPRRGAHA